MQFKVRLWPRSMRGQLLALLVVVLVPALLMQFTMCMLWYRVRARAEMGNNLTVARSMASVFHYFVEDVARNEIALGLPLSRMKPYTEEQARNLLQVSADENPEVKAFRWVSPDGKFIASADSRDLGVSIADRPYFQQIRAGKEWAVSDLLNDRVTGVPTLVVARGIRDAAGQLEGIIVATIDLSRLSAIFSPIADAERGRHVLFDRQGHPVYAQGAPRDEAHEDWPKDDPLLQSALAGKEASGTMRVPAEAAECFAGYAPVAEIGWVAGASRPVRETMNPLIRNLAGVAAQSLIVVALSSLIAIALYRRISAGLRLLERHLAAIGRGELDRSIHIESVSEFDAVAAAMDRMALDLKRARDAAEEANRVLERRVEERTCELQYANESLRQEIIEREKAQKTLMDQSRILEAFYKHTATPLIFLDREFNFIRVNEAYAKACQTAPAEFPGKNHFGLYPSAELEGHFRDVVRDKKPYIVLARPFTFPDRPGLGVTYWDLSVWPLIDASGEVEFLVFSLEDVTERTLAGRRARVLDLIQALFTTKTSRKEYLDSVVEVLQGWSGCESVGIRVIVERRHVPYVAYVGFSEDFMRLERDLSLDGDICICPRIIAGCAELHESCVMTSNGSFICNNAAAWVQGLSPEQAQRYRGTCIAYGYATLAVIPVNYRGEPLGAIHLADPRPGAMPFANVEFLESITPLIAEAVHRFDVEDILRNSEKLLAEAQRIAHLGGWDWSVPADVLSWSDEMYRIFGLEPQSVPINFARFIAHVHPDDRARVEAAVDAALRGDAGYEVDYRIILSDQTERRLHAQGEVIFDETGRPVRMLGTVLDATEQVRSQEEAELRRQQLVQADKMVSLGILVSGVAHEINNPNHSIMSNVAALADVWESVRPILERFNADFGDFVLGGYEYSESRDKIPEMFRNALASSKRIQVIVDELRDFARSSPAEKMAAVDIGAVVESAVLLVSNMVNKATDAFDVACAPQLPAVLGNHQRIEQVVINLIQNACRAIPSRDKRISVSTAYAQDSNMVIVEVCDEGKGIPEDDLRHLGDPFFTTNRSAGGMGLGLWVSFNIVHEHGGTLTFQSKLGEGTRAVLALPVMHGTERRAGAQGETA